MKLQFNIHGSLLLPVLTSKLPTNPLTLIAPKLSDIVWELNELLGFLKKRT